MSFRTDDGESYSRLFDLTKLCAGAAYAFVLSGTLDRVDQYDPLVVQARGGYF